MALVQSRGADQNTTRARRYEKGSMFITTNQVVTQWRTVFGDEGLTAAVLDRLLHHSFTLMVQRES